MLNASLCVLSQWHLGALLPPPPSQEPGDEHLLDGELHGPDTGVPRHLQRGTHAAQGDAGPGPRRIDEEYR